MSRSRPRLDRRGPAEFRCSRKEAACESGQHDAKRGSDTHLQFTDQAHSGMRQEPSMDVLTTRLASRAVAATGRADHSAMVPRIRRTGIWDRCHLL